MAYKRKAQTRAKVHEHKSYCTDVEV